MFDGSELSVTKLLSLNKDFIPFSRFSSFGHAWKLFRSSDEYIYSFSSDGIIFKMVCKKVNGHLYPFRFYVYMYDEYTGEIYKDDNVRDFSLYIYNTHLSAYPILRADKSHSINDFKYSRLL